MTSTLPPRHPLRPSDSPPLLQDSFPNSTKVYIDGPGGIRVPMREISLSGGEPPLRVYDTSGPQGHDVGEGLPLLRSGWISQRPVTLTDPERSEGEGGDRNAAVRQPHRLRPPAPRFAGSQGDSGIYKARTPITQLYYARRGDITEEMEFVAIREGMTPEFVRSEVARGRAIIPANIN